MNVVNLNFLLAESDINIPEGGVDLGFSRVYNSESQHDDLNDDNSTPSVYGNRWTNNLDAHLAWSPTQGNNGTISVYTADGARDDFSCNVSTTNLCTAPTGIYDLLAPTQIGNSGVACQFQLTEKSGVSYIFNAPYQGCTFGQGSYGRLQAIDGRNSTFSIQLTYKWFPDDSSAENITHIIATHEPDGAQLTLNFSEVAGSSPEITELSSLERPDGETSYYYYTANGELVDVSKPGNNPILLPNESMPANFADGNVIGTGNLPETYDIEPAKGLLEVCGPRAAIAIIDNPSSPADGACADFDYSNHQLTDWLTRGVLNPTPNDNVVSAPIQSGPSTGFAQWPDTQFFSNMQGEGCTYAAVMSDTIGHQTIWCYDSSNRVTQTYVFTNVTTSLSTAQSWDANNDLVSLTDARSFKTNIAYDASGNMVEVALPSQSTSKGTLRPTYLLDYDQYNNVVDFCDPANNANNGWNPSQSDTLCQTSGSSNYTTNTYKYSDPNEAYGCLNIVSPPSAYKWNVTYGGQCGNGQPTKVAAATSFLQDDQKTTRQQTEDFSYNTNGTINTYDKDNPNNTVWQYNYTTDGMNRLRSIADPDGVTSYTCYNQDGSLFYSETAQQDSLDNKPSCPTVAELEGGFSPPQYATSFGYDPDGNTATVLHHHGCGGGEGCSANTPSPDKCNNAAVDLGTTCYFYDGLNRLVEVRQPLDPQQDLYSNPWLTRYLYDLSGSQYTFHGNSFYAYGNLFETQELLPTNATQTVTGTPAPQPTSVNNSSYVALSAFAYDGANRLATKYTAMAGSGSNSSTTETLTWDTSPLDTNLGGLLGEDCNSATPPPHGQCQEFDYYPDGEKETFVSNDNSAPQGSYTYDPDGRAKKITEQGYANPQTYAYDVNGNLITASDAGGSDYATLTYNRYPDDTEESLDVSSLAFSQKQLFDYSYRNDGPLQTYLINDGSLTNINNAGKTTLAYTYTNTGRFLERQESGVAANTTLPATVITYTSNPPTGLISSGNNSWITPLTNLSGFTYSAEGELIKVISSNAFCSGTENYAYSLRGELAVSPGCASQQTVVSSFANGAVVQAGITPQSNSWTWNDLMGIMAANNLNSKTSSWTYDGAGRMTSESEPNPYSTTSPLNVTTTRTYDAENHLNKTVFASPSPNPYNSVQWGPDGHPITIGASDQGAPLNNERLHWSGDQLLFTTHNYSGAQVVDDIKVDVQGDVLPGDTGYSGLTFYDRGPGGTIMGCHNVKGASYDGINDSWSGFALQPCLANVTPQGAPMPTSLIWGGSPYNGSHATLGSGGTLGMYRTDGITDGFDTIQGMRAYDPTSASWTTPDGYGGTFGDPASQKAYLWNGNNPMGLSDPTGYYGAPQGFYIPQLAECSDPTCAAADAVNAPPNICGFAACATAQGLTVDILSEVPALNNILLTLGTDQVAAFATYGNMSAMLNTGPVQQPKSVRDCSWNGGGSVTCAGALGQPVAVPTPDPRGNFTVGPCTSQKELNDALRQLGDLGIVTGLGAAGGSKGGPSAMGLGAATGFLGFILTNHSPCPIGPGFGAGG